MGAIVYNWLIKRVLGLAWDKMNEAERRALVASYKLSGKAWMGGGAAAAFQAAFIAGGFQSYMILVIMVNAVVRQAIGVGLVTSSLTLATNAALTRTAAIAVGPHRLGKQQPHYGNTDFCPKCGEDILEK